MNTDPVADYLTRIRNANQAGLKTVEIPSSNIKKEITKILVDQGFILNYKIIDDNLQGIIKIALKYDKITSEPVIKNLQRVSKPGLRKYSNSKTIPRVLNGLGISIVSTSKGLMTGKKAKSENLGGEIICNVYELIIMSRVGNSPILIPEGVNVQINPKDVIISGKLGSLTQTYDTISLEKKENQLLVSRNKNNNEYKSKHGLYRSLFANMITGVSEGYTIDLELVGVGYRASNSGQNLQIALGFSHNIVIKLADEVKVQTISEKGANPIIKLTSHDKQLVGMVAAKIRSFRKPEPYKGKGVRYVGEQIRRKAGKSA